LDYLLDTNTLSALIEANQAVVSRISRIGPAEYACTSVISEGELLFGLESAPPSRHAKLNDQIRAGLSAMADIVPVFRQAARAYSDIRYYLQMTGQPMGENDMWIAAIALANDYTLVSHDNAFTRIPTLKVEDWLA
jgi:tRNA(fMet)-specific endonuclease VapC